MSANPLSSNLTIQDDNGGAKAIEVATMLGDSVVDVKHCMDPQSGTVSKKTWGLAAAGLACVLMSAAAFTTSVRTAARNKEALQYWTQVAKKPAGAFRAEQLSFGYDWVAFGGFALGIGALAGAASRARREKRNPFYRIGTAPDVQQPVEGAPSASFPLVAPQGDDFVLNFGAGISGDVTVNGTTTPLAELAANGTARPSDSLHGAFALPIPMNARIRAQVGQTSFLVSGVAKPREQAMAMFAGFESRKMTYVAGSLAAHLGLVMLLNLIPADDGAASVNLDNLEMTDISSRNSEKETPPDEQLPDSNGGGGEEAAAAAKMALEEGQAGTEKSSNTGESHIRIKNNNVDPQVARMQAIEEARTAGVLGSATLSGDFFANLTSQSDISSGFDSTNVYGAIYGADGEGYGHFGFGRRGFGKGGGCDSGPCDGIIGTGGYGKIGLGKFGREGYAGPGGGGPGSRQHHAGVPVPRIGEPTSTGDLDRSIIRRYIKRNIEKIGYCYEKELLAKPGMSGTISVSFFITPTGSVTSSVGAGFDSTVANCVASVVGAIEFPRPNGGGGVQVNYPFTFRPSGQ